MAWRMHSLASAPKGQQQPSPGNLGQALLECHRLARWIVTFLATADSIEATSNATGLPGGSLRSSLQRAASKLPRMPPACRWIVTFLATADSIEATSNATGLPGGSLRSLLQRTASKLPRMPPACPVDRYVPRYSGQHRSYLECHRLARWIVTFLATADSIEATRMPPACPVDRYVPCYSGQHRSYLECHRLARWIVTLLATVAENVSIHRASRWH